MAPVVSARSELVLIGGQIGAGKTAVAEAMALQTGSRLLRVRVILEEVLGGASKDRAWLQREGASLDQRTSGRWLLHYLSEHAEGSTRLVVDAARTRRQVEPILEELEGSRLVYLAASEPTRRHRFALSSVADPVKRSMSFDRAMQHGTEQEARTISAMAHFIVETDGLTTEQVVEAILEGVGWTSPAT
jgi:hypothetical protein